VTRAPKLTLWGKALVPILTALPDVAIMGTAWETVGNFQAPFLLFALTPVVYLTAADNYFVPKTG
jgi:hypothetical protein